MTQTHKQNNSTKEKPNGMHNQPGIMFVPQGHLPICARPCETKAVSMHQRSFSERCYTARQQTVAYWISRYYTRTVTQTVHLQKVCREHQHEKPPLIRFGLKWHRKKSRDLALGKMWRQQSGSPHNNLRGEENARGISFNSVCSAIIGFPVKKKNRLTQREE